MTVSSRHPIYILRTPFFHGSVYDGNLSVFCNVQCVVYGTGVLTVFRGFSHWGVYFGNSDSE